MTEPKAVEEYNYANAELAYNRYMASAYRGALRAMEIAPDSQWMTMPEECVAA